MSTKVTEQKTCLWIPGMEPDAKALQRLQAHGRKPTYAMGESWFMGERIFFTELLTKEGSHWTPGMVESALTCLASGPGCFGIRQEWTEWLHYLLPTLPARIDGQRWAEVYESLVSALMARYPDEQSAYPYDGFREDVLATLGRMPMAASGWKDGLLASGGLISSIEETAYGLSVSCGGSLSAGLFLHLKYLDEGLVATWLASVLAIEDPVWRIKLVLWIAQSRELLLKSGQQPDVLENEPSDGAGWQNSWCLKGSSPSPKVDPSKASMPFLSDARRHYFRGELGRQLTCASLNGLGSELADAERARPELYGIRERFDRAVREIVLDYQLQ